MNLKTISPNETEIILGNLGDMINKYKRVELAESYKKGFGMLEALKIQKSDATIVEVRMSGLNATEVLSEIKRKNKNVKIFMLTMYTSNNKKKRIQEATNYFFTNAEDVEKILQQDLKLKEIMEENNQENNNKKNT